MRKIVNFRIVLLVLLITISGCTGDFLDDLQPTQQVSEDIVFGSREGAEAFLSGIARQMRARYNGQSSANVMTLYGARIYKGNDMMFLGTGFWNRDYDLTGRQPTDFRCSFTWNYCYYIINQTNNLINGLKTSNLSETDKTELSAQGKALRAFFYFQLVQEFSHTYSFDISYPAPPIYTELSLEGKSMSTVGEVYDFILSDLTDAVAGLTSERLGKSYVNKEVAAGLLARVYLVMENWSGAEQMANMAYDNNLEGAFAPELYSNGFDDYSNPEWIWGMPQEIGQSSGPTMPATWLDVNRNAPYKVGFMNINFTNQFSDTDVRNTFVVNPNANALRRVSTNKFLYAFESDYALMRKPEMVLIEAEAKFRQGDEAGATSLLTYLQKNRDPNAIPSNNSGSALEEEILLERRKELYGEIGVEWFDAKRLRRGIDRTANHKVVLSLEPDDNRFILSIPQSEIDANVNIDASVNADR